MQRRQRRSSNSSKKKFLPALGIFNKQRNSKPVFKSGSASRRIRKSAATSSSSSRRRRRDEEESSSEEEEECSEEEESDEEESDNDSELFESEYSEDDERPVVRCTTSERRKRRASYHLSEKSSKKPKANSRALREVSSNSTRRTKYGGSAAAKKALKAKQKQKRGSIAAYANKREIGGLELRANRDSLKIERHNNLEYFNKIQDELRDLVQQRDEEAATEAEAAVQASSPNAMQDDEGSVDEDYGEPQDGGMAAQQYVQDGGGLVEMTPAVGIVGETPMLDHRPPLQHSRSAQRRPSRSPSIESVYSHHSAASYGHSRSSRPSARPPLSRHSMSSSSRASGFNMKSPMADLSHDMGGLMAAQPSRSSDVFGSSSSSSSRFPFENDFAQSSRSNQPETASPFATPDSPPPSPFVDPAASALGLHEDLDPVPQALLQTSSSSRSHTRSSRSSRHASSRQAEDLDFSFGEARESSRSRNSGFALGNSRSLDGYSGSSRNRDSFSSSSIRERERRDDFGSASTSGQLAIEEDDLYALPEDPALEAHGSSRDRRRSSRRLSSIDFQDYEDDVEIIDVSNPTPPLAHKSRSRMKYDDPPLHVSRSSSSGSGNSTRQDFAFMAGTSSDFRVRPRHGY